MCAASRRAPWTIACRPGAAPGSPNARPAGSAKGSPSGSAPSDPAHREWDGHGEWPSPCRSPLSLVPPVWASLAGQGACERLTSGGSRACMRRLTTGRSTVRPDEVRLRRDPINGARSRALRSEQGVPVVASPSVSPSPHVSRLTVCALERWSRSGCLVRRAQPGSSRPIRSGPRGRGPCGSPRRTRPASRAFVPGSGCASPSRAPCRAGR